LNWGVALALTFAGRSLVSAQTAVTVQVQVLEAPRTSIDQLLKLPSGTGFSRKLTSDLAQSLFQNPQSKIVHRLELQSTSSQTTHFRVDSRTPTSSGIYYEIGIGVDVTPLTYQNRDVALNTNSRVRILQSPDAEGRQATAFENPPTRNIFKLVKASP
jgi:hypothetical protein